ISRTPPRSDQRIRIRNHPGAHMIDLLEDSFFLHSRGHHVGHVMLQRCAKSPARHHNNQQNHQHAGQRPAESKSSMKQNHGKTQQSEPKMPTHPTLRSSQSPYWKLLPCSQQSREHHARGTHNPKRDPNCTPAARSRRGLRRVKNIHSARHAQNNERSRQPFLVRTVNAHFKLCNPLWICQSARKFLTITPYPRPSRASAVPQKTFVGPRGEPRRADKHRRSWARQTPCTNRTK